jgi:multiple sugar transport system substrate-binding protein
VPRGLRRKRHDSGPRHSPGLSAIVRRITDMYAKAIQGMPPEESVKWAHAELVKVYA